MRAVGLMAATTSWITFADDDVRWESDHLTALFSALANKRWATTLRTIWSPNGERLGVDRFESVGDDPGRRVPYEMCDNNCMIFSRELGTSAAVLYRETREYNDDRLMYGFLRMHGGPRGHTDTPTLHQTCPERLVDGFRRFVHPNRTGIDGPMHYRKRDRPLLRDVGEAFGSRALLALPHRRIGAAPREQRTMGAALDDAAIVQDEISSASTTVESRCAITSVVRWAEIWRRFAWTSCRCASERARGLVEDEDRRILQ